MERILGVEVHGPMTTREEARVQTIAQRTRFEEFGFFNCAEIAGQKCRGVRENDCGRREGKVDSSRITAMALKITIEKGEFLQKESDFRSYEWS